jgi:hypothetical protein
LAIKNAATRDDPISTAPQLNPLQLLQQQLKFRMTVVVAVASLYDVDQHREEVYCVATEQRADNGTGKPANRSAQEEWDKRTVSNPYTAGCSVPVMAAHHNSFVWAG